MIHGLILRPSILVCALGLLLQLPLHAADEQTRSLITAGGGEIDLGKSVPGIIEIRDDARAVAVLTDTKGRAIAAASAAGEGEGPDAGRVVAFSHGSFLKGGSLHEQDAVTELVANAVRWAGKSRDPGVAVHPNLKALAEILIAAGLRAEIVDPADFPAAGFSVYCMVGQPDATPENEIDRFAEYTATGGGLVTSATPWAFAEKFPDFAKFPGNRLLTHSSIRYRGKGAVGAGLKLAVNSAASEKPLTRPGEAPTPKPVMPIGGKPTNSPSAATDAALKLAENHQSLGAGERGELMAVVESGIELRGDKLATFLAAVLRLNQAIGPVIPTKENPIRPASQPFLTRFLRFENQLNQNLPAGAMYAIPAAADYPGAVPEDAERITHDLTIDGTYRGWLSGRGAGFSGAKEMRPTGVYAAPGEKITVNLPAKLAGEGFEVIIGSYKGSVEKKDAWNRHLQLMTRFEVTGRSTEASNGLGGLVNIRVPNGAEYDEIEVTIEGGVRAPLYIEGVTDLDEWKKTIRKYPAPWAEIAGKRMILALPSDHIRSLNDPDEVVAVWNGIIESCAELVGVDRDNYRAERVVFDRQISAGSMHSGYPFAAHIGGGSAQAVDAKALKSDGNWGFFHELGHNHQHDLWSLPGTGETTCNLWSVYVFEEFIGKNRDNTHGAIGKLNRRQRITEYFKNDTVDFAGNWSVWTALETYLQIQEEFGWEPFTRVFIEYNELDRSKGPKTQQEKNDRFVVSLSRAVGKNLAPFWQTWGLPLSAEVHRELKDLPVWEDHPVKKYSREG